MNKTETFKRVYLNGDENNLPIMRDNYIIKESTLSFVTQITFDPLNKGDRKLWIDRVVWYLIEQPVQEIDLNTSFFGNTGVQIPLKPDPLPAGKEITSEAEADKLRVQIKEDGTMWNGFLTEKGTVLIEETPEYYEYYQHKYGGGNNFPEPVNNEYELTEVILYEVITLSDVNKPEIRTVKPEALMQLLYEAHPCILCGIKDEVLADKISKTLLSLSGRDISSWWCPECKIFINSETVTNDERHDERSGGCGCSVKSIRVKEAMLEYSHQGESDMVTDKRFN